MVVVIIRLWRNWTDGRYSGRPCGRIECIKIRMDRVHLFRKEGEQCRNLEDG